MKRLILLLALLTGRSFAQNPVVKSVFPVSRTVTGIVKNTEGADVYDCVVILKSDVDSLLTMPDISGHFTFENVNGASFSLAIRTINGYTAVYPYKEYAQEKLIVLPVIILKSDRPFNMEASHKNWKAGDKLDAGPDIFRPASVIAVNNTNTSFFVHYEDGSHPDGWIDGRLTRPYNLQFKADSAAATKGLRVGKYEMAIYHNDVGQYQGYFMINADGTYEVFLDPDQQYKYASWGLSGNGEGKYSFSKTTGAIKWLTGPFSGSNGIGHLSVSIDGSAYVIQPFAAGGFGGGYVGPK